MENVEFLILRNLLHNEIYLRKVLPFIKEEYFEDTDQKIVFKEINKFVSEYNTIPTKEVLCIEIENLSDITQDQFQKLNQKLKNYQMKLNEILKLIQLNDIEILKYVLQNYSINLDIIDNDGKNCLYYPIKNNNLDILNFLIDYDKKNIGISILDKQDINGFNCLFYSVIENKIDIVKILLENNISLKILDNDFKNIIDKAFEYNRTEIIKLLIEKLNNFNYLNYKGENLLQIALNYNNIELVNYLLDFDNINLNNQEYENGITILHHAIIIDNKDIYDKILKKNIDVNITDKIGNSAVHYSIIEKNFDLTYYLIENFEVDYNNPNIYGNILLHSFLDFNFKFNNENYYEENDFKLLIKLIENSDLNNPNNDNLTCLHLLVEKYLWEDQYIFDLLKKKLLNIFIKDNNNETVYDKILNKDKIIDLTAESYYYNLKKYKEKLEIPWEKKCSIELKTSDKDNCLKMIKNSIIKDNVSIPQIDKIKVNIDSGIFVNVCFYTGSTIDIIFGLVYLKNSFNNIKLLLEYPLTKNQIVEDEYKKLGLYYNFKLEFSNIYL